MIICPNCGTELADEARFCRICGTKLEAAPVAPEVEEVEEAFEPEAPEYSDAAESAETEVEKVEEVEEVIEPEAGQEPDESDPAVDAVESEFEDEDEEDEGDEFEEPVVDENGNVSFDWNQPVKMEEPEGELEYGWDAPTGVVDGDDPEAMVPVYVGGEDEDEDGEDGWNAERDPWDHTDEFDPEDISENKVMALAAYILGPIGIIIALLASQLSPYAGFHVRQALKIDILIAIVAVITTLLCWTFVVPIAGAIVLIILLVLKIIAFFSVCKGKAVELPIIRGLRFLK